MYKDSILTASEDKILKVYESGKFKGSFIGHTNWVNHGVFNHDATHVVSASDDHSVRLWDAAQSQQITSFNDHQLAVNSVSMH